MSRGGHREWDREKRLKMTEKHQTGKLQKCLFPTPLNIHLVKNSLLDQLVLNLPLLGNPSQILRRRNP